MIGKLKTIISQYKIFILLAAFIPIFAFILFLRHPVKEPPANPIFGSLPAPETEFEIETKEEVDYQLSLPHDAFAKFPQQLSVYQIKKLSDQDILNRFAKLASELDFSVKPVLQSAGDFTFYVWKEEDRSLKVNSQTGQFLFKGKFTFSLGPLNPQEAEGLAKEKLFDWGLIDQETKTTINYYNMIGLQFEPVTNPNLADIYEVVFSSSINDSPVIGLGPAQDIALARITKNGQLLTLDYLYHQIDRENIGTYPLKPANIVLVEIQQGQGKILSAKTQAGIETNIDPNNPIKSINLSSVELVYYESVEKQEYLQPIYLFSGTAILEDDEVLTISLYLPAVSSEWLIQASPTPASKFKAE